MDLKALAEPLRELNPEEAQIVDDAIKLVTTGLTKHPDYLSAHIVLGRCHLDRKDDAGAGAAFGRVLELEGQPDPSTSDGLTAGAPGPNGTGYKRKVLMTRLGLPELVIILVIVILIFGANRLPELGKGIGKAIRNFKDATNEGEAGEKS